MAKWFGTKPSGYLRFELVESRRVFGRLCVAATARSTYGQESSGDD